MILEFLYDLDQAGAQRLNAVAHKSELVLTLDDLFWNFLGQIPFRYLLENGYTVVDSLNYGKRNDYSKD